MKPVFEFLLACMLVLTAGCSAIAGFFSAGLWTIILFISALAGFIFFFTKAKSN